MRNLTPLLLSVVFLAGCANAGKPVDPASNLATQVNLAEGTFDAAASVVDLFADIYDLQPATRQRLHNEVDAARTLVANLKADFLAGRLDGNAFVKRVGEVIAELRQNRTAVVASEPKARNLRAVKSQ